ncbi:MAG: DUF3566 domain-containing protein, partial [Chloroflexota bacterium]|nr:DUF3566 domain-containing protein [Chloroflexota bacterium]
TSRSGSVGTKRPQPTTRRRPPVASPRPARRRVTVQRIHPWSVLKLSLIFYFCLLLVVMVALAMFWSVIIRLGLIEALQEEATKFGANVRINGGNLARMTFLIGLINVVLWSAINVFMAFLYNLIADLIGGFRVTLSDDDATE